MEHGWAFWWIIPMMMFFWWGPHRYRRGRFREEGGSARELDEEIRARLSVVGAGIRAGKPARLHRAAAGRADDYE